MFDSPFTRWFDTRKAERSPAVRWMLLLAALYLALLAGFAMGRGEPERPSPPTASRP